jgi:hypothetical protein
MKCTLSDLRYKEVINTKTGQRLGYINDVEIDMTDGTTGAELTLCYAVFEDLPVITRFATAEIYRVMPDGSEKLVKTVPIGPEGSFDSASLAPETPIHYQCNAVEHPEWAIVLPVN